MSKLILDNWLSLVGFEANPFGTREAESEGPELSHFFVEYPYFDEMRGSGLQPKTTFLFADRGCGKSANRCMIEESCRKQEIEGAVLPVPHTDFRALLREAGGDPAQVSLDRHVHEILQRGVLALLDHLREHPRRIERLYNEEQPRWLSLAPADYLTPPFVNQLLRQAGALGQGLTATRLESAIRSGDWRAAMSEVGQEGQLLVRLLVPLLHARAVTASDAPSAPVAQLREFVDLARFLGFDAVYALVDRVDELPETADDPQAGAMMLRPLLKDLSLLELPHVAFKFFLPTEMQSAVQTLVRIDRVVLRHVSWTEDDLGRLLEARLRAFSRPNQPIESLSQVSAQQLQDIDQRMIRQAVGSPRNLIRLGALIFSEHCRLPVGERLQIDVQDWRLALRKYWSELGLQVNRTSGRVVVAGRELLPDALTPREYDVLQFLYEHAGQLCTRDEIAYGIYGSEAGAEVSGGAIDQAVSRLRKKIEPGEEPLFIVTIPGKGYRLDHARAPYTSLIQE